METKINIKAGHQRMTGEWCRHCRRWLHKISSKKRRQALKIKTYED